MSEGKQEQIEFELYSYWRSSASWRIRAALKFKGINHKITPINILKDEQRSNEYLSKNPSGFLPTLVHNGNILIQSPALLEYLEEIKPEPALLPADALGRARVRGLAAIIYCDTHPVQNLTVLKKVGALRGKEGVTDTEFARWVIWTGFTAYEKALSVGGTVGKYSYGDTLTIADLCLFAQGYNAERFGVDLTDFPLIRKLLETLSQEDCIKSTHPSTQIDAVQ
ncbi:hypothetical protein HK100_007681 [Physocladia obscura]|uniref:Maleylacetoacetate isomerase n=1 Tax=Physocladia obscura TaxID=109957 RepID=A0AAD5T4N4_9FUNG|nr:hypothetical protein HK100_007681 [Physocladia obscura]